MEPSSDSERRLAEIERLASTDEDHLSDEPTRTIWTRKLDCILALVGYTVGLNNIWRFPYLCIRNGGAAFLIPYWTFLIVCGFPLYYLELLIGQFSSLSTLCVWKICPLFKGVGWSMIVLVAIVSCNHCILMAWIIYYLVKSLAHIGTDLPWSTCDNWWNTPGCTTRTNQFLSNTTNLTEAILPVLAEEYHNRTNQSTTTVQWKSMTPSEEFWQYEVLQLSNGIDDIGPVRWQMLLCLAAAWLIICLCLSKSIKSLGKVVYVTATAPYLLLTVLLIRGLTLPGSMEGIRYFFNVDISRLGDIQVWGEACLQVFYSLGPGWGGVITMASFNKFNNNCLRDSLIVCVTCGATSLYAGCVIFPVLGFMAHKSGLNISEVVTSGPGLAFIVYPEAINEMPFNYIWAIIFFLMLLTVGLDCMFGLVETIVAGFVDTYPKYLQNRKFWVTAATCLLSFILGIPFTTRGGMYIFQLVDWYIAVVCLFIITICEILAFVWIYGPERQIKAFSMMRNIICPWFWKICWCVTIPICLLIMLGITFSKLKPINYGEYHYPEWAIGLGWVIATVSIVPIPIVGFSLLKSEKGAIVQRFQKLVRPAKDWGPANEKLRAEYKLSTSDEK